MQSFAQLLRHHRLAARLTQESLAERAGLSVNTIQKLESGASQPYRETARRLGEALQLSADASIALNAAAHSRPRYRSSTVRDQLPTALTTFIGREGEAIQIKRLLASSRLVTLSGVGGCGKTRLAVEVARGLRDNYPDGVWFVDLATIADPALVPQSVASVLRIRETATQPLISTLTAVLKERRLLLLLDNCEHLLQACADIADTLLRACPALQILATSREVLRVPGEVTWGVPPMATPPHSGRLSSDDVRGYESVQLFVDRVRRHSPEFEFTDETAQALAQICQRLDGIPLALELAAPLIEVLPINDVVARLDRSFHVLTQGSRTALPRQRTLWATMDWSYQLLTDSERLLFARLSVFGAPWRLDAAEDVCAGDGISADDVLGLVLNLVRKSLVTAETRPRGSAQFRLLDTLREFGREQLSRSGRSDEIQRRHASYFLTLVMRAEADLTPLQEAEWIEDLAALQTDLLAAVDWFVGHDEVQQALDLAAVLARLWDVRGHLAEGRRRLAQLLALPGAASATLARAKVLDGAGVLALYQADSAAARSLLKESLAVYRRHRHTRGIARTLMHLGWSCHDGVRDRAARRFLGEALELSRRIHDRPLEARCLNLLGLVEVADGDVELGLSLCQRSLQLSREIGDRWSIAWAQTHIGMAIVTQAQLGRVDARSADSPLEEALTIWQEFGERRHATFALYNLGVSAALAGNVERAVTLLDRALTAFVDLDDSGGLDACLSDWSFLFWALRGYEQAVRILGATYGHVRGKRFFRVYAAMNEARLDQARALLGDDRYERAWAEGCAMSRENAIAYVRQNTQPISTLAGARRRC